MEKRLELIEFTCSHNNGRSPLAEAFGRQYLEDIGASGYRAISSGTHVDEINAMLEGKEPFIDDISKLILEKALERDFFSSKSTIEKILCNGNFSDANVQNYVLQASNKFVSEEQQYKEQAFEKLGLGDPKIGRNQTIVMPESKIILGMGKENVERINEIYKGESSLPIIETLAGYDSGNSGQEFKSGFGGGLKDYLAMGEVIRSHVHGAIDRFLKK